MGLPSVDTISLKPQSLCLQNIIQESSESLRGKPRLNIKIRRWWTHKLGYNTQHIYFLFLTVLFTCFTRLASQNTHFPATAFDEFYMKGDPGLPNEVNANMDNSQMLQNTGFNSQGIMAVNDNSSGIQISHCVVGQSPNGHETAVGRPQNTIPSSAEVWWKTWKWFPNF